jgi:excinuclease ABC subunit C
MSDTPQTTFDAAAFLRNLSERPGVYQMYDAAAALLYVGKASNLRKRVSSYFQKTGLGPKTEALVARIAALSRTALADATLVARFRENGATPWPLGPEELGAFRAANERAFAPVIRASGAVVE